MASDALAPSVARSSTAMILQSQIGKSLSFLRKDSNYLWHDNVEEWYEM